MPNSIRYLIRNRRIFVADAVLLPLALFLSFAARFDGMRWWPEYARTASIYLVATVPLQLAVLAVLGIYRRAWRVAGVADLEHLGFGAAAAGVISAIVGLAIIPTFGHLRVPLGVVAINLTMIGVALAGPRLALRVALRRRKIDTTSSCRPVLLVGAGQAGALICKEMTENRQWGLDPVGFLDDDPKKLGLRIHGRPVLGSIAEMQRIAVAYAASEVIIAIPTASGRVIREIVRQAHSCGLKTRTMPGLHELVTGRTSISALRKVEIQDLLRRESVATNLDGINEIVSGRIVLVTGAGGSIGSELCRQIAQLEPACLVALGRGENSIFEISQELRRSHPHLDLKPVIADVRDSERMRQLFEFFRPNIVFHAAAHKHVPLMENAVAEAILNNVLGTRNVATMAESIGAERFVLVSTDKAVRPTSIMGASKRLAEQLVHHVAEECARPFVSVRFGNVLGSRGSVVPTFLQQIASGGPVTITHPDMSRYFMTIPEAVHLVLQAGALGQGGEVFVLDMGDPVKIVDLATDLIRLSGLEVGTDIEIKFTGARPGEKLYEELFFDETCATRTTHPKVLRARESTLIGGSAEQIDLLILAAKAHASQRELRRMIRAIVPDYQGGGAEHDQIAASGRTSSGVRPGAGALELVRASTATSESGPVRASAALSASVNK